MLISSARSQRGYALAAGWIFGIRMTTFTLQKGF